MQIEQFFDKGLAHLSYAIKSGNQIVLIDPARNPHIYYAYTAKVGAVIVGVIETHLHADFVSSHVEIANQTGARVYISKLANARYPHQTFDDGDKLTLGACTLRALNTPGHSPESISIVVQDEYGKDYAVFTGDTLFVGDVGRPDLREGDSIQTAKEQLAAQLFTSLHTKLLPLSDHVKVFPSHGPGSLCGKNLGAELESTIEKEKRENAMLQQKDQQSFIQALLTDSLPIPKYFPYTVHINKTGAPGLQIGRFRLITPSAEALTESNTVVIDTRPGRVFKNGHIKGAINIPLQGSFEMWLGSIVAPDEMFFLVLEDESKLVEAVQRVAKIGYDAHIQGLLLNPNFAIETGWTIEAATVAKNLATFTILDVRNETEVKKETFFESSLHIPLFQLRERISEIDLTQPIAVHCASGYRSAIACSLLEKNDQAEVYDIGDSIQHLQKVAQTYSR